MYSPATKFATAYTYFILYIITIIIIIRNLRTADLVKIISNPKCTYNQIITVIIHHIHMRFHEFWSGRFVHIPTNNIPLLLAGNRWRLSP